MYVSLKLSNHGFLALSIMEIEIKQGNIIYMDISGLEPMDNNTTMLLSMNLLTQFNLVSWATPLW